MEPTKGKKKEEPKSVIFPLVRVNDRENPGKSLPHAFELIEQRTGALPEMKAVGYCKVNELKSEWCSYTVTFKGSEVLKIEVGEPNLRQISEDEAKIAFVEAFVDKE